MSDNDQPTTSDPSTASAGSTASTTSAQTLARCLAVMSGVAAVIHFAVANEHYQEYWAFGVFMVGAGLLQGAWTGAALLTMKRWLWAAGAVLNGGIVAVYIVTRTVGDVVGPTPHELEPVGFGDAFCTVLEALIAIGCVALLMSRTPQPVRTRSANLTIATTGGVMAVLLVVALLDGGPEMSMSMSDDASAVPAAPAAATTHTHMSGMKNMPGMQSGSSSSGTSLASLRIATRSPAGAITTMTGMNMGGGMKDVSAPCSAMPTAAQQAATVKLVNISWRDAQKYRSLAAAKAAGYVPITPTGQPIVHYLNLKSYEATAEGGPVITPAHPESLVYANTPKGAVLAATMYLSRPGTVDPPQPGGCLTPWHIHTNLCFGSFGTVVGLTTAGECASGSVHRVTPPMMHVWYVPIPGGPTAVDGTDAQIVRAAEHVHSPHNGTA
jgi:hypothetical protein